MTAAHRPFEVLFLTNFSTLCFRAIPALAQMSDEIDMRLTILHASGGETDLRPLETNLRNFFPEADHFSQCRRVLERGTAYDAVRRLRGEQPVDLVVAPAGDPLGLPRLGHQSLRTRLMRETGTPLWTSGQGADVRRLVRPTRSVACVLEDGRSGRAHLRLAAEYAERLGASLHIVHLLPYLFDEGSLLMLAYADPFDAEHAVRSVRQQDGAMTMVPEVHAVTTSGLQDLLRQLEADIVFLEGPRWTARRWLRLRLSPEVDELPCPAVCVDAGRDDLRWALRRPVRQAAPAAPRYTTLQAAMADQVEDGELVGVPAQLRKTMAVRD